MTFSICNHELADVSAEVTFSFPIEKRRQLACHLKMRNIVLAAAEFCHFSVFYSIEPDKRKAQSCVQLNVPLSETYCYILYDVSTVFLRFLSKSLSNVVRHDLRQQKSIVDQ